MVETQRYEKALIVGVLIYEFPSRAEACRGVGGFVTATCLAVVLQQPCSITATCIAVTLQCRCSIGLSVVLRFNEY